MKLASGICIPEPLPVHTGIKWWQVHPLIRFLLRSRVDEKCAEIHKPFIFYLFLVGVTVQSAESLSAAIPLGTSTKKANSKRANHGGSSLFKIPFRPCPSGWGHFLSADDGHDRCLQCLVFQHAEDAFMDDFAAISPFLYQRIGTLFRHPCRSLCTSKHPRQSDWVEQSDARPDTGVSSPGSPVSPCTGLGVRMAWFPFNTHMCILPR